MRELAKRYRCLFDPLDELESFRALADALKTPGVYSAYGPDDAQRAHLIAGVMRKLVRPALVVVPNEMAALRMTEDLGLLLDGRARNLPARDISFLKTAASSRDLAMRRIEALGRLRHGQGGGAGRLRRRDDEPPDAGGALPRAHHRPRRGRAHGAGGTDAAPDRGGLRARAAGREPRSVRAARRHTRRLSRRRSERAARGILRRRDRLHPQLRRHDPALDLPPPVRAAVPGIRDAARRRRGAAGGADAQQAAQDGADGQGRQPPEEDRSGIQPDSL